MELKGYQKSVLADLKRYLELLIEMKSAKEAYTKLWGEKGVSLSLFGGMRPYKTPLENVPQVCLKVPTGGGKTYLAACSLRPVFDAMRSTMNRAVVWLVPSDAILRQTYSALSDTSHPYRARINVDFASRVQVYSKEQLLCGQNFSPASVAEQLSIFVLSYDSFRSKKKVDRKAYQENGNLAAFEHFLPEEKEALLADTDETALIQVVRKLNPVIVVDESHHATTELSVEMLKDFNPSFVLELTATPHKNSNIISFVDALQLKKEQMVKLPVIVYNRKKKDDVFIDAISIRDRLERCAEAAEQRGDRYIRPIVLFQAEPKVKGDSTSYEQVRKTLVDIGIPEDQIAIKTAGLDELKGVDLLSRTCPIRYIITVNALKEGWDCPFAYVLATVANRSSVVEVEQIVGRVLRQPYARSSREKVLNLSYVITSSNNFNATVDEVVKGLNRAGFSKNDYRVDTPAEKQETPPEPVQGVLPLPTEEEEEINIFEIQNKLSERQMQANLPLEYGSASEDETGIMLGAAIQQGDSYTESAQNENTGYVNLPSDVRNKTNLHRVKPCFREDVEKLLIPQFMKRVEANLLHDEELTLLDRVHLYADFNLLEQDTKIDFNATAVEFYRVDIDESDSLPRKFRDSRLSGEFKKYFNSQPGDKRIKAGSDKIYQQLRKFESIQDHQLKLYLNRVMEQLDNDQLADLQASPTPYTILIQKKIQDLLDTHARRAFSDSIERGEIVCEEAYRLSPYISPIASNDEIPTSLYEKEEDVNGLEQDVIGEIAGLENVRWWHRNLDRAPGFCINGFINHYPDFIVMTKKGTVILVETKGDHLDNPDSQAKAFLGDVWAKAAGNRYRYYMVFNNKQPDYPGAYSRQRFMKIIEGL